MVRNVSSISTSKLSLCMIFFSPQREKRKNYKQWDDVEILDAILSLGIDSCTKFYEIMNMYL